MSINELKQVLCEGVDMARADLWETNDLVSLNEPTDVHGEIARGQAARAEIWQLSSTTARNVSTSTNY